MTLVKRELSIEYGGFEIGGSSRFPLHGKYVIQNSYSSGSIDADFIVSEKNNDAFVDSCNEVEKKFRIPRQHLIVRLNGSIIHEANAANNMGYNHDPTINKVGDDFDSGLSRHYRISIVYERPADLPGQAGRRDSSISVVFAPGGRRTINISGNYTAIGSNSARKQYENNIEAYQTSITTGIGGVYELTSESADADDTNKNLQFSRTLEEVLFNQSSSSLDDKDIFMQSIIITRQRDAAGDSFVGGNVHRLERVGLEAQMFVDKDTVSDLNAFYKGTLKGYLINLAFTKYGFSSGALVFEQPVINFSAKQITVRMSFLMVGASNIINFIRTVEVLETSGKILVPVWETGKVHAKHVYSGPARIIRTIVDVSSVVDGAPEVFDAVGGGEVNNDIGQKPNPILGFRQDLDFSDGFGGALGDISGGGSGDKPGILGGDSGGQGGGGFIQISRRLQESVETLGAEPRQIKVLFKTDTIIEEWVDEPKASSGVGVDEPGGIVKTD